jgi:hypothetical protein
MHAVSEHIRPEMSFLDMRRFAYAGWGRLGTRCAEHWLRMNRYYFGGKLTPIPIIIVSGAPYGRWRSLTCHCGRPGFRANRIELARAGDQGDLLHAMLHQALIESGRNPAHDGAEWCHEVMRVHRAITRERIWCAPDTVAYERGRTGKRRGVRRKPPPPDPSWPTLTQKEIASWRNSLGLQLGEL